MTLFSHGYVSASSEKDEAFKQFKENIDLLKTNAQRILETAEYFFCELPFAWCSWPYVGGDGPFCLGFLMMGWQDGIFVEPCPDCAGDCLVVAFGGSPLSGSNSWSGLCTRCLEKKSNRDTVHKPFFKKVVFVTELRKRFPQEVSHWEEYQGVKFSFGGNGVESSIQKRMVTTRLFEAISLNEVISEFQNETQRPKNDPESGFENKVTGLKISSR